MSRIELQIVALGNFANVQSEIAKLNSQVIALNKNFSGVGISPTDISRIKQYTKEFDSALRSTGAFTAQQVQLQSETEKFGKSLEAGHLKLRQYFSIINQGATQSQGALRNLAVEQTKLQSSIVVKDPLKGGLATVYTPTVINEAANAAKIATNQQKLYNMAIDRGATSLINWGKNTQWAGRQLTVGLTVPLTMFGNAASKVFQQMDTELTRMQKVYGTGLVQPSKQALTAIRADISSLASELAKSWGTPIKETAAMAADLAATGKTGLDLVNATREALRLATLGELDKQQAMQATVSLQNVYKLNTQQLSEAVNFLNAVENQTSTSLQDLVDAIPRVGPIVAQMGGSFKDTAAMMVAMKEAGVPAAQSANAIKAALASMINPTKAAKEAFKSYGIDVAAIAGNNKGNPVKMLVDLQQKMKDLAPLAKEQLIEKMFGKFQMSRISALLDNLNKAGSQSQTVFALMQASSGQLANMAQQELKIQTESTTGKYKRAVESLKADLLPIGEQFTKVITKIINFGDSVVKMLDKLGPMKNLLGFILGFVAVAGPLIMLTGVFGNLFGYIMKGISLFRNMRTEGAGLKGITGLLTAENIAASQATELMSQRMLEDVDATKLLASAIDQLNLKLESMVALMSRASQAGGGVAVAQAEAMAAASMVGKVPVKNPGRYGTSRPKKFAQGVVMVPGSGEGDTVPAMLSPGESVISASNTRKYQGIIQAIHDGTIPGFANERVGTIAGYKEDFEGRQPAHLNDDKSFSSFSKARQTDLIQQFGIPEEVAQNRSETIKIKDAFLALWHTEVNQLANNGKLVIAEMIQYLQKVPTQFTSGGQAYGFKKTPSPVTHDPELAYGAMAQDLGIPASERQAFYDEMDRKLIASMEAARAGGSTHIADRRSNTSPGNMSSGEFGTVAQQSIYEQGYGDNLPSLLSPAEARFSTQSGSRRRRFSLSPESRTSAGLLSWAAKHAVKNPSGNLAQEYSEIRKTIISEANVEAAAIASATPIVAGAAKKSGEEVDKAFGQGTGSQSKSRKAKKRALEYTQGAEEGLIQGTPALVATAEQTGIKVDEAMGTTLNANSAKSKTKMGLKGRMGGGMGLMAGSMAMNSMGSNVPGGSLVTGAMTGASLGMMFGPEGAAIGALAGLAISGISALIEKEKLHQATVKATFSQAKDLTDIFGTSLQQSGVDAYSASLSVAAIGEKSKTSADQVQALADQLSKLPKDSSTQLVIEQIKKLDSITSVTGTLRTFMSAQVSSGIIPVDQVEAMTRAILTSAGKGAQAQFVYDSLKKSLVDVKTATKTYYDQLSKGELGLQKSQADTKKLAENVVTTADAYQAAYAAAAQVNGIARSYENLTAQGQAASDAIASLFGNILNKDQSWKDLKIQIDGFNDSALNGVNAQELLAIAIKKINSPDISKAYTQVEDGLKGIGHTATETMLILAAIPDVLSGALNLNWGPAFATMSEYQKLLILAKNGGLESGYNIPKPKVDGGGGGGGNTTGTTTGTDPYVKLLEDRKQALQDQKDALDKSIQAQKDYNDQLQKTQDYLTSTTDLENQIRVARAKGDYLQVGLLKQQLASKQTEFTSAATITPAEKQSQNLADQISELAKAIADANSVAKTTKVTKKAGGGYIAGYANGSWGGVFGAGTATSDSIPAYLSNGEYVLSANAVKNIPGNIRTLDKINGGDISSFSNSAVNNYSISVNVAGTNANPDQIAQAVLNTIQRRSNMNNTTRVI